MGIYWVQERVPDETARRASGVERGNVAVTIDDVVAGVTWMARIVNPELRVIKDVETLRTKLHVDMLPEELEVFEERHVEVQARGIVEAISPGIAEGEASRGRESGRIQKEGSNIRPRTRDHRFDAMHFTDDISV